MKKFQKTNSLGLSSPLSEKELVSEVVDREILSATAAEGASGVLNVIAEKMTKMVEF